MKIITLLITLITFGYANAQKIAAFSIAPTFEGNLMSTDGFGELNKILKKNNVYTIQNEFQTNGIAISFSSRKKQKGVEIGYLHLHSYLYDSTSQTNRAIHPLLTGTTYRISFFWKLFETKRWYSNAAIGIFSTTLSFKLVDRKRQVFTLDSLIANPSLSPTLDLSQRNGSAGIDVYGGIYFKTKWLKKAFDDFDIGAKFGYSYTAAKGSQWLVNGTINNFLVKDLPSVKIDNLYFQLSFLFKYNFIDMQKKKA